MFSNKELLLGEKVGRVRRHVKEMNEVLTETTFMQGRQGTY